MAKVFDQDKIFEIPASGVGFFNTSGNLNFIISSGEADPVGTPAPQWSRYYRTNGEVWVKFGPGSNDWQDINVISSVVGQLWTSTFHFSGGPDNKYMQIGKDLTTSETHFLTAYRSRLKAITVANKRSYSDIDIEFYKVPWLSGTGTTPQNMLLRLQLRDFRIFRKTNFTSNIEIEAGDKLMIYTRKAGDQPEDLHVVMYWQVLEDNSVEQTENYNGKIEI